MKKNRIDIDLFSDTKTRPSQEMREYIFRAEVGDEQSDEDPTTIELCERVAGLLGKERALFLPSGTMCNQIALAVHCGPGDEVIADETAHIINFEVGGAASTAGAMVRAIKGENGIFTAADVEGYLRQGFRHMPKSRLVVIEQTSNLGGGTIDVGSGSIMSLTYQSSAVTEQTTVALNMIEFMFATRLKIN